jgi:hypothetical protein
LENQAKPGYELVFGSSEDNDIVNENKTDYTDQPLQYNFCHGALKPGWNVS